MTTAGYGPTGAGQGPGDGSPGGWPDPARSGEAGDSDARPGPLPPRIIPPRGTATPYPPPVPGQGYAPAPGYTPGQPPAPNQASVPGQAPVPGQGGAVGSGYGAAPAAPSDGYPPAQRSAWAPPPTPGQWGGSTPAAGQYPPAAGQQSAPPGVPTVPAQPSGPAYAQPTGPAHPQVSGPAYPQDASAPGGGPAWPATAPAGGAAWPAPAPAAPARGRALTLVALGLAVVLAVVAGVQAYQINRLSDRLAGTDRRVTAAQEGDATRLDDIDQRTQVLEKQAGRQFNPEAVASAVLPSVFRVRAGQFTGTAFAIGEPAAEGGTNLFTNFHVVESVWKGGGREVFLERTDQRYPATIVRVDEENDVAHLRTTSKFTGLAAASATVKSGQQIVVVGAPLGLQDSVTTGVVSAFREAKQGSGPVIQFDAPINPGNSGGPVINGQKQVVGIATAKARDAEGIGLAVPIKVACDGFRIC